MRSLACLVLFTALATSAEPLVVANQHIQAEVDATSGRLRLRLPGAAEPFAQGAFRLPVARAEGSTVDLGRLGRGPAITVHYADGSQDDVVVIPGIPFALLRPTFAGTAAGTLNRLPITDLVLAGDPSHLTTWGTGGLVPPARAPASYAWLAVARPAGGDGVVAGWVTQDRSTGVVAAAVNDGAVHLTARSEYGHQPLASGATLAGEILAVGWWADARLGLEAWADAVARVEDVRLKPQPVIYCTFADNVHSQAGDERSIVALAEFAARHLKPWGFSCVQIDDGWQLGTKGNGPTKVFTGVDPKGPYPGGMAPVAERIRAVGLTAGLWGLPFGGTWNDPFYAPHQDWFATRTDDGKPFDTVWGGTALDMTHPGAQEHVRMTMRLATQEWGYRYLKLDGLSTGLAVKPQYINDAWREDGFGDARFHDPAASNVTSYRQGLRTVREGAGDDTYILGCSTSQNMRSYAASFGLVDAMRTGPDNNGTWAGWLRASPLSGTRHHHLNGRVWWNDPDPVYVRPTLTVDAARCEVSWTALTGQQLTLSDWLPALPAERLDILRRGMPHHGGKARAIDLFEREPARLWLATDDRPGQQRRDVLGVFNWGDTEETLTIDLDRLGLPPATAYAGFDFWGGTFLPPIGKRLEVTVGPRACRIIALRPQLERPFLLSTNRHIAQGFTEITDERWDEGTLTLSGTSAVVAGDYQQLRIVARAPNAAWSVAEVRLDDPTCDAALVGERDGLVRVRLHVPSDRRVGWSVRFTRTPAASAPATPPDIREVRWESGEDRETLRWSWHGPDGAWCEMADPQGQVRRLDTSFRVERGLEPGTVIRRTFTAVTWDGRRSAPVEVAMTLPAPPPSTDPPKPTVRITSLTPTSYTTATERLVPQMTARGAVPTINRVACADGLGVKAPSQLVYAVKPEWRRFTAIVGLDDEVKGSDACVTFQVIAIIPNRNPRTLVTTPPLRSRHASARTTIDVALPPGTVELRLIVNNADHDTDHGHADWIDAGFLTAP